VLIHSCPGVYIQDWGDLVPVLASAKPADEHPAYDAVGNEPGGGAEDYDAPGHSGNATSAPFDLDLIDVAPVDEGYRGTNPLGHHGDSEDYFTVGNGGETATDHKHGVGYNALTYLLVEAGERSASNPGGDLSDADVFAAWREAKDRGTLDDEDPIPYRALVGVAVEDGLVDREELVRRDSDTGEVVESEVAGSGTYRALPPGTYDDILDHVRKEYGVEPAREPASGGESDGEDDEEYRTDPREVEATVDPRRAWDAAGRVTPEDLDAEGQAPACRRRRGVRLSRLWARR